MELDRVVNFAPTMGNLIVETSYSIMLTTFYQFVMHFHYKVHDSKPRGTDKDTVADSDLGSLSKQLYVVISHGDKQTRMSHIDTYPIGEVYIYEPKWC